MDRRQKKEEMLNREAARRVAERNEELMNVRRAVLMGGTVKKAYAPGGSGMPLIRWGQTVKRGPSGKALPTQSKYVSPGLLKVRRRYY